MRLARFDEVSPTKNQRAAFSCGESTLDRWLATQARQSMDSRDAVTYLLLDGDAAHEQIVGCYCLSAGSVRKQTAPMEFAHHGPDQIPVIRMGRFAIDSRFQGSGWGADLLGEALLSAVNGARLIGGRVLLVDAISDRAAAFYLRFGFIESPTHPLQLFKDIRVIAASAGLEESTRDSTHES